ncbi:MAG: alpha/beta hydrolase [Pseudomonadota bacterium]
MVKTILMIHGVGCGGEVWDKMRPAFEAEGWACDAPTLFPQFRTPEPTDGLADLTLNDYVEAMAEKARQIEAANGEKPVVIGHSMGGLIAQKLTEAGLVEAGIFLTPAQPEGCTVTDLRVMRTFWSILKAGRKNIPGGVFKVGPNGFSWGVLNCVPKSRHDEIYKGALYDSGRVYEQLGEPWPIDESHIKVPTLTIGAKKDRATVIKAVRKVGEKYEGAAVAGDYLEYADHAHWIVDEPGTERVTSDILDWLKSKIG